MQQQIVRKEGAGGKSEIEMTEDKKGGSTEFSKRRKPERERETERERGGEVTCTVATLW